jgi:peptidyl-dipeptidase A
MAGAEERTQRAENAIDELNAGIDSENRKFGAAYWLAATFPSPDARAVSAAVEDMMRDNYVGGLAAIEREFGAVAHQGAHVRKLMHLGHRFQYPLPAEPRARNELEERVSALAEAYNAIEICYQGACYSPADAEARMRESVDPAERDALWTGMRKATSPLAQQFALMKESLNEAARGWGYADMGDWLVARYELPPEDWNAALESLSADLEPLAGALRCHVAAELGIDTGSASIPATALRSLWGRDWSHLHDAVRRDLPGYTPLALNVEGRFDNVEGMVKWAETAYRSAGFPPLPESFWERSQLTRPNREISACPRFGTNVDWYKDVRLTMCGELDREHFLWSHGILAFLYYDLAFAEQDWVFRDPPHLGFHFANSNAMELALTPEYLQRQGLIGALPSEEERLSRMLHDALRILPRSGYGIAADRWRTEAFQGLASPEKQNERWRVLRERHQGVSTPAPSGGEAAEPFAHALIARNAELTPSALGEVLQYQFYREACRSAGHEGPLHTCSFYGNDAVAGRLWPILAKGASKPWYDALEAYTGSPRMTAEPLLEYFAPLMAWLATQNEGRSCG